MTMKDNIYNLTMHTNASAYFPTQTGQESLTSDLFITLYSREEISASDLTGLILYDAAFGYALSELGLTYGIREVSREWLQPAYLGEVDSHALVCHLRLELNGTAGSLSTNQSVPNLAAYISFSDGSSIGTWASAGNGFEMSTPALNVI